ncbi:MAG: hypothetical protein WC797_04470 [Candidatus Paceibacterota bacterium]|jgi:phospho-N-acetylmuramoyl-pentapeptide-transferase
MQEAIIIHDIVKVSAALAVSFFLGIAIAPFWTNFLYAKQMWKKTSGKISITGEPATVFSELHKNKAIGTPRMGGVIIWGSVLLTIFVTWAWSIFFPTAATVKLNFLSQNQTWLPLFTLIAASLTGLVDDLLQIWGGVGSYKAGGLSLAKRLLIVTAIGLIGAWWFYFKLEVSTIFVPFLGNIDIGVLFIPFFILVMIGLFSGGVIDGIDGLSGGVMATIFAAYAGIAFLQNQIDLAAFCAAIVGGTMAFLWFNIPPARFYMTETGILGLTATLAVVAFLTDAVVPLLIIAFPLVITTLSDVIQVSSKKLRGGKKVFLVAPLHHHFEAIGWPAYKVTMRYWIFSIICAVLGMVITVLGKILV